jgi:hypothetical protein
VEVWQPTDWEVELIVEIETVRLAENYEKKSG